MKCKSLNPDAVGSRIRLLRRQCNLTQAQLAAKVGIGTGPLNTLENGHHLPSLPVLCRLASILHVDVNQILEDSAYRSVEIDDVDDAGGSVLSAGGAKGSGHTKPAPAKIIRFDPFQKVVALKTVRILDTVINAFLALEDICNVHKNAVIPLKLRLPSSESGLQRFVAQVRSLFGIYDAVIFDYLELFENSGLRVVVLPLPKGIESVSFYDRECENAFFFVATGISAERQLFRLCYELGRIYLYNGGLHPNRKIGKLDGEHAARRFAALFLMPEEAVVTSVRQVGIGPGQWTWEMLLRLKHRFGVSAEAFLYRLSELDLIDNAKLQLLKTAITKHYKDNGNTEPDSTRRVLTPNGRLGDLLTASRVKRSGVEELPAIRSMLDESGIAGL
jgi:Zn-dependent peptidase ImmA (M78 family)/DNA-binding XRE family transcriptional regulator